MQLLLLGVLVAIVAYGTGARIAAVIGARS